MNSTELKNKISSKEVLVENLRLSSDGRLLDCENFGKDVLTLYHGSPFVSVVPEYGKGEDKREFGKGLYFTDDKELAKEWSSCGLDNQNGYLHKFILDTDGLSILDFTLLDPLHWIAELMSHRSADSSARYNKFAPKFVDKYKIDTFDYDVIIGWRADSSYFKIAKDFVRDCLDINLLNDALNLESMSSVICVKSKKAFNQLYSLSDYNAVEEADINYYFNAYKEKDESFRRNLLELEESENNTFKSTFSTLI